MLSLNPMGFETGCGLNRRSISFAQAFGVVPLTTSEFVQHVRQTFRSMGTNPMAPMSASVSPPFPPPTWRPGEGLVTPRRIRRGETERKFMEHFRRVFTVQGFVPWSPAHGGPPGQEAPVDLRSSPVLSLAWRRKTCHNPSLVTKLTTGPSITKDSCRFSQGSARKSRQPRER